MILLLCICCSLPHLLAGCFLMWIIENTLIPPESGYGHTLKTYFRIVACSSKSHSLGFPSCCISWPDITNNVQGSIATFSDSPPPPPHFLLLLLPEEVIGDPGSLTRSTTFEWSPIFSSSFPPSSFILLLLWLFCPLLKKVGWIFLGLLCLFSVLISTTKTFTL